MDGLQSLMWDDGSELEGQTAMFDWTLTRMGDILHIDQVGHISAEGAITSVIEADCLQQACKVLAAIDFGH